MAGFFPSVLGSFNTARGKQFMGALDTIFNGKPAGRKGDMVTPHPSGKKRKHPPNPIVLNCSHSVIINGRPAAYLGNHDICKHKMIPVKAQVIIGP
jgi:uncharacterized Zn-binding protein involved in type VI secretion